MLNWYLKCSNSITVQLLIYSSKKFWFITKNKAWQEIKDKLNKRIGC